MVQHDLSMLTYMHDIEREMDFASDIGPYQESGIRPHEVPKHIIGIRWYDRIHSTEIIEHTALPPLTDLVRKCNSLLWSCILSIGVSRIFDWGTGGG